MQKLILTFLVVLIFPFKIAHAASSYNGTWNFTMKVVKTTCKGVNVGDTSALSRVLSQSTPIKKMIHATLPENVVGTSESYTGYIMKNGLIASLDQSCPIVPDPVCVTRSQTFTFLDSSRKYTKVVWLNVTRDEKKAYVCTTAYSGTARKKKATKK